MEKRRKATYTVRVPMQFSFLADSDLTIEELAAVVSLELNKRLADGYFDVLPSDFEITEKVKHYTREEKLAQKKLWDEIFANMLNRGLRR